MKALGKNMVWALVALLTWGVAVTEPSSAAPITLTDQNSVVVVDPAIEFGLSHWEVDGVDHMYQQWFWYRIGNAGPEAPVNGLPVLTQVSNGDFDPGDERLVMQFSDPQQRFQITVDFTLTGGAAGTGISDLAETISIQNLSRSDSLPISFFQYVDADLAGTIPDDSLTLDNANAVSQTDGAVEFDTIVTPAPDRYELGFLSSSNSIYDRLTDGGPDDLANVGGSLGSGDLIWAFQWNRTIAPGGTFIISKDKHIEVIPEPSSLVLAGLGGLALALVARRRSRQA